MYREQRPNETVNLADTLQQANSPLAIGVSGHRNLHPDELPRVRQQIEAFLQQLQHHAPDTELRVMVGMAQGADLLVAQAAVAAGLDVDAILPMPLEQYSQDFDSDSSALLMSLLQHPKVHCAVLSSPATSAGVARGDARDALYTNLTAALIDKSSLLLALWNGQASSLPGGTADTVLRYLGARTYEDADQRQIQIVEAADDQVWGSHVVYWIPTPRVDDVASMTSQPKYLTGVGENLLAVHDKMPQQLEHQLAELNMYNREFARLRSERAIAMPDSLMSAQPQAPHVGERQSLERIDLEYGKADSLAIYYQKRSDRLFRSFSYMASSMALLFLLYAKLVASSVLLSLYLAILTVSLTLFYWVRERQWFFKHLVYRVLAETMRTKFYLRMAGADRLVNAAELIDLTGISQFAGFSWIGAILKNVEPLDVQRSGAPPAAAAQPEFVRQYWIRGQQSYFSARARKLERTQRRLERTKGALLYLIALLTLVLVVFADALHAQLIGAVSFKDAVIFLMGLLPVWLGIWELYQNKMATRELLWQYRSQLSHFTRAELQLSRSTARDRHRTILAEVGKESLMESYLWTIHRYHREYEPPSVT